MFTHQPLNPRPIKPHNSKTQKALNCILTSEQVPSVLDRVALGAALGSGIFITPPGHSALFRIDPTPRGVLEVILKA